MARNRWPKEAPVFRVNCDSADKIADGSIVEGICGCVEVDGKEYPVASGFIAIRAIDFDDIVAERGYAYRCLAKMGYFGCYNHIEDLIPLTPAARAMLAIAKAGAK